MSIQGLPPFHLPAGQDEEGKPYLDRYALAFVWGEYVSPSGSMTEDCFSVIYFRPSSVKHTFCLMSITQEGRHYSSANPSLKNIDQMLMWAWDQNQVHPGEWLLYGEEAEDVAERIVDPVARLSYLETMRGAVETVNLFFIRRLAKAAGRAFVEKRGLPTSTLLPLFRIKVGRSAQPVLERLTESEAFSSEAVQPAVSQGTGS